MRGLSVRLVTDGRPGRALASGQRDALCDALLAAGPSAPTLCEGWTASDIATHVYQLRFATLALGGLVTPRLAPLTRAHAASVERRLGFEGIVAALRRGWGRIPAFGPDGIREGYRHHLGEYFVHAEDVVRGAGLPPGAFDEDLQDALWLRVQAAGRPPTRRGCAADRVRRPEGPHLHPSAG